MICVQNSAGFVPRGELLVLGPDQSMTSDYRFIESKPIRCAIQGRRLRQRHPFSKHDLQGALPADLAQSLYWRDLRSKAVHD